MLLLITGSKDGTSDLICRELGKNVFRFNFDIFQDYELKFTPDFWQISNPVGLSISSETVTTCFWWKAFNFAIENQDNFIVDEVKYIFRELYNWCRLKGIVRGTPFDFHNHLGKINLLKVASKYFLVPKTLVTFKCFGVEDFDDKDIVAKSLTSSLTANMGSLLTTSVDPKKLHPDFPWYLQSKINSEFDVTVFVCGERLFAYEKSRVGLSGLDWRGEQSFDPDAKEWFKFELSNEEIAAVHAFCKDINVNWGRIDFMRTNNELSFLEFNANGQWVFLDYKNEDGLLPAVLEYVQK